VILQTQTTQNRGEPYYRGDSAMWKRDENRTWRKRIYIYIYMCVYMCTYVLEDGCRRFARVGAQFCSVNLWHRARGVYHSASEFVVLRLVTSKSIFRTQTLSRLPSFYLSLCSRLFTCIIFAKDTRKMFTRFCAFKVVSYKPRALRRNPTGFLDKL